MCHPNQIARRSLGQRDLIHVIVWMAIELVTVEIMEPGGYLHQRKRTQVLDTKLKQEISINIGWLRRWHSSVQYWKDRLW
jgi:hypothetical protein